MLNAGYSWTTAPLLRMVQTQSSSLMPLWSTRQRSTPRSRCKKILKKRQRWGPQHADRIEHLGLSLCPAMPLESIEPRHGWNPVLDVIARLGELPGSAPVRERLAIAFVRPHFTWAAPLLQPPPEECAKALMKSILRTKCSWYCRGRWWADRVHVHPSFAAGLQAFKPSSRSLP